MEHLRVAGTPGPEGLVPTTDRFGVALADISRCPACGHMQTDPMPATALLGEAYAEASSAQLAAEQDGQRRTAVSVLDALERYVAPGRLLDVGCWTGALAVEAAARGWSPTGIEPSRQASRWARENLGLDVRTGDFFTLKMGPERFSALVMADVIEHLPDPGAALDRAAALLAPGGVLALTLPDAGSRLARRLGARWWSVLPTHVQYFTRASLQGLLRRHGYEPLLVRTAPKAFSVGYYLGRVGGYSPALGRSLVAAAGAAGLASRLWAPDLRDRMLVLARATGSGPSSAAQARITINGSSGAR